MTTDPSVTSTDAPTTDVDLGAPGTAERVGLQLAAALAAATPPDTPRVDTVMVGEDLRDLVLGHVVARELGAALVPTFDDEGLVRPAGDITAGAIVALVGLGAGDPATVRSAAALAEQFGARLALTVGATADSVPAAPTA